MSEHSLYLSHGKFQAWNGKRKGQFTHAIFDAIFVAISTAIFVAAKLQLQIARVNQLRFQCDSSAISARHRCNFYEKW